MLVLSLIKSDGESLGSAIHPATDQENTVLHPTLKGRIKFRHKADNCSPLFYREVFFMGKLSTKEWLENEEIRQLIETFSREMKELEWKVKEGVIK